MLGAHNIHNTNNSNNKQSKKRKRKPRTNGGKYGFGDYQNSPEVTHKTIGVKSGDSCSCCGIGKYYVGEPKKLLAFSGNPIINVTKHTKDVFRCNACGHEIFSHKKIEKWSPEARSSIAIHKLYGTPLYRIARLQKLFGIPVAVSTLWQQYQEIYESSAKFIVNELYNQAPDSELMQTDDTGITILEVLKANKNLPTKEQRACHTTVMCFKHIAGKIILYKSANRYCKENWQPLVAKRKSRDKLLLVSDASSQSLPSDSDLTRVIAAGCLGNHGRRKFADLQHNYPKECGLFLDLINSIYKNEAACKEQSKEQRLKYHQQYSQPLVDQIYNYINELFANKVVEPNSDLGKAMNYWLNHKLALTAFLRIAGCPIDNNWAEFELRIIALYRKVSLFFKNLNTAQINSDMFSLIATCEANNINSFDYLNWIQKNWKEVRINPTKYLPWRFKIHTEKIAI